MITILALSVTSAFADDFYWGADYVTGNANTASNWFTDAAGTTAATIAPGDINADNLYFNTTPGNNTGGSISTTGRLDAYSLTFNTTGYTKISGDVHIGAGGVTVNTGSGGSQIDNGGSYDTYLTTSQTWTNYSSSVLRARQLRTTGSGAITLTLDSAGTGGINFSYIILDTTNAPLTFLVDTTDKVTISKNSSTVTWRGGTIINRGELSTVESLGSGDVLLGDTSGSANAKLTMGSAYDNANNITVRSGSSGSKTISTGGQIYGTLTLNDTLLFTSTNNAASISGAITGTGDFVKTGDNTLTLDGSNTSTGDFTIDEGNFTLDQSGAMTFYIGANGVNNQINGISTDSIELDGTFDFDLGGASLVNGNSWSIVSLTASETYGSNFNITGFSETGPDLWTNGSGLTFSEMDGTLSFAVIPEPSSVVLMICGLSAFYVLRKRRK